MWPNPQFPADLPQFPADLVAFTEEVLNENSYFVLWLNQTDFQ